ncbi:hypothetical protein Acr_28g0012140 [Actinidia rufa]|uniref:Transmembrane protein n=1 Tax=Actinidia rufa TaxID=165716 RepID=A0A7J0HBT8_9ERIC|nr:hypothetical protein Acr_28g0012140 [Actinidia rufa]
MDEEWVIELNQELKRLKDEALVEECQWGKRSIYKVPTRMTDKNKKAFQPQVVSFGPYHHGEEHLMPMEEHKHRALFHFLERTNMSLQSIVDNLTKVVEDLKDSYDLLGDDWQSETGRFLRLMVLDGCFMLEVLCYYDRRDRFGNYAPNDPIFSFPGNLHVMPYIRRDMLLLENQLPLRVLIELAAGIYPEKRHAREFVNRLIFWFTKSISSDTRECLHLLDIFRKGMLWSSPIERRGGIIHIFDDCEITVSATELHEAGISFEAIGTGRTIGRIEEISFKDRVFRLPFLVVDDTTESMFLNLMAYERLHVGAGNEVTSYVYFMGTIIKNVRDVILLKSNYIIQNGIGSEEAVVELFKSLSKGVMYNPNSIVGWVLRDINVHRRKPWVKYRANFFHGYHVSTQWNPWAYWSIIFAILLFTLTVVQTAYTIFPYYRQNK